MDFAFSPEELAFRQELREFLRQELPQDRPIRNDREQLSPEEEEFWWELARKLARKGWLTMAWPKEYGGQAASPLMQLIFNEEMSYERVLQVWGIGVSMVGPVLMTYGTEEQKARFLPPIARAEEVWCQGFSEPEAGSDLASLRCQAVADGDHFIINGEKIWTSEAHRARWMILLARTDPSAPKHRGISCFFVDMKSPGVTIQPLVNILNSATFNQIYFDNVRVPRENLIGELNQGWYVATLTLEHERVMVGVRRLMEGYRFLEDLVGYVREVRRKGGFLAKDYNIIKLALADLRASYEVGRLLNHRAAWLQQQGQSAHVEAAMAKTLATELDQKLSNIAVGIMGIAGQLLPGSPHAPLGGCFPSYYMATVGHTIAAGTSEIQRNIIAQRGLGLPRE